jgi:transcriptional regulator with XRE-family HTH domain
LQQNARPDLMPGMDVRRIVGKNVRKFRQAAKLTQAEMAGRMGVDRTYIVGLEKGERNVTIETLGQAAKALGLKVGRLLDE